MRKIILIALSAFLGSLCLSAAFAQSSSPVLLPGGCGTGNFPNGSPASLTVDSTGRLCDGPGASTSGGASESSTIIPNNTTAVVVKAAPGQVYGVECFNNSATVAYLKIYNAITATAGSGTPFARYMCPASTSGAGFVTDFAAGVAYSTGITFIMTTGIADNDTGAPAANTYIVNVRYK